MAIFTYLVRVKNVGCKPLWFFNVSSETEEFNHRLTPINTDSVEAKKTNLRDVSMNSSHKQCSRELRVLHG